jgi:quercetin dioxygenase-like cupin family protein
MSSFCHVSADASLVRSFRVEHSGGNVIEPHRHTWHQLMYASHGAMEVTARKHTWLVPSRRAIWVPAGELHSILSLGRTLIETIYVAATVDDATPDDTIERLP